MLYYYLSDGSDVKRISIMQFMIKFKLFWPLKSHDESDDDYRPAEPLPYFEQYELDKEK